MQTKLSKISNGHNSVVYVSKSFSNNNNEDWYSTWYCFFLKLFLVTKISLLIRCMKTVLCHYENRSDILFELYVYNYIKKFLENTKTNLHMHINPN